MTREDARTIASIALERALRTTRGGSQAEEDCIADAILAAEAEEREKWIRLAPWWTGRALQSPEDIRRLAVAEERARCAEIVLGMRNQRHAYRRIVGDPKARLPEYHHWALPFIDDVTLDELRRAQPLDQWHEAEGDVLWWKFPVSEPPYVGSPLDTGWPGYHTHWTRIALPDDPNRRPEPEEAP
jgi:hypothetical protein